MNRIDFVEFLHGKGANIQATDNKGDGALHYCASRCFHNLLRYLVEQNADINVQNQDGNTPLHVAAQSFKPDSREWEEFMFDIIRLGGDINAKNQFNKIPQVPMSPVCDCACVPVPVCL